MKGTIFLFQWDKVSAQARVKELKAEGWKVEAEFEDGARGGKKVLAKPPDIVVMDLAKRPSHSRETANALRAYKAGRNLKIVFVDGSEEDIQKAKLKVANPVFTTSAKLRHVLESLVRSAKA